MKKLLAENITTKKVRNKGNLKEQKRRYRERYPEKIRSDYQRRMDKIRELKDEVRQKGECQVCGYNQHREILQFHHINPSTKKREISEVASIKQFKEERAKCILLCPNCHALLHRHKLKIKEDILYDSFIIKGDV